MTEQAEQWLEHLYEAARAELNPGDDDCPHCGGEGETHDCIDGCCEDAEYGCDLCTRACGECVRYHASVERWVRTAVVRALDVDLGRRWLMEKKGLAFVDRLSTRDILLNLHAARCAMPEFSDDERANSACWVEGLLL